MTPDQYEAETNRLSALSKRVSALAQAVDTVSARDFGTVAVEDTKAALNEAVLELRRFSDSLNNKFLG
jgi:hypothetical protein